MKTDKKIQDNAKSVQTCVSVTVAELRIGNLTSAGIVSEIQRDCFYVHDGESSLKNTWFDIQALPLTEEWLLKFGFYYSDDENEFLELQLMHKIKLYADNSNNFSTAVLRIKENEIEIKSVHQLQNLHYALTGSELQISSITEH